MSWSFALNSKFRPLTYNERVQPLLQYKEVYDKMEQDYSTLATQAEVWKDIANREKSPKAYEMYRRFSEDLSGYIDDFSKGMSLSNRAGLMKMKPRYAQDIIPIQRAYEAKQKDSERIREQRLKDPTTLVNKEASDASIDDYLGDNRPDYKSYSGALITKQVSDALSALKNTLTSYGKGQPIDPYTNTFLQQYGLSPQEALNAINNPRDINSKTIIGKVIDSVIKSSGIDTWNNPDALNSAYNYASQGIWQGIGKTTVSPTENFAAREGLKHAHAMQLAAMRENNKKKDSTDNQFARITFGAPGESSEDAKRLEGLRKTPTGYSTNKLDKLERETAEKRKKLTDRLERLRKQGHVLYTDEQFEAILQEVMSTEHVKLGSLGKKYGFSKTSIYGIWNTINELDYVSKDLDEEKAYIKELQNKYAHLSPDDFEALSLGSALEKIQQNSDYTAFAFNAKNSQYNDVRNGLANILFYDVPEEAIEAGTVGLKTKKGEKVSFSDMKEIFVDESGNPKFGVRIDGGNNPSMVITHNGKDYIPVGFENIKNFNDNLKVVNDYLKDFSINIANNSVEISDAQLKQFYDKGDISSINITPDNLKPIEGTNKYRGITLHNNSTGDYIKIMLDSNYNVVATNSLSQELAGGHNRDAYFMNMASQGISSLLNLTAADYD